MCMTLHIAVLKQTLLNHFNLRKCCVVLTEIIVTCQSLCHSQKELVEILHVCGPSGTKFCMCLCVYLCTSVCLVVSLSLLNVSRCYWCLFPYINFDNSTEMGFLGNQFVYSCCVLRIVRSNFYSKFFVCKKPCGEALPNGKCTLPGKQQHLHFVGFVYCSYKRMQPRC